MFSQTTSNTFRWRPPPSKGNSTSMNSNTAIERCLVMHMQSVTQICSTPEGVEHRGNPRSAI